MYDLYHHGVKGQKWGVRNGPPYPLDEDANGYKIYGDGRIEIPKGTKLQRLVGKNTKQDLAGMLYASFTANDNARYIVKIGGKGLFGGGRDTLLTLTAKKDLKSPSAKEAATTFFEMLRDNPKLNKQMDSVPLLYSYNDKELKRVFSDISKNKMDDYQMINSALMFEAFSPIKDAWFSKLKEKGYNMLRDENDVSNGYSKNPIILFDGSSSVSLESSTFISDNMRKEAKAYNKETIRLGKEYLKKHGFKEDVLLE